LHLVGVSRTAEAGHLPLKALAWPSASAISSPPLPLDRNLTLSPLEPAKSTNVADQGEAAIDHRAAYNVDQATEPACEQRATINNGAGGSRWTSSCPR
jgi:hypothetical protein